MIDPFLAAILAGGFLALIYVALHVLHLWPRAEPKARPFYYGIGFLSFLAVGWGWAIITGNQGPMGGVTIIGIIGGLGMAAMYLWDGTQEQQDTRQVDTAAGGPPHVQP